MKILAIVPARGGSKGIPRKNMRLMRGKPLISYAIENALNSQFIDDVVVSSDSEEVLSFAGQFEGVLALDRSTDLACDAVTLDPVVYDATIRAEELLGTVYDVVVTLQPTSPLLTVGVLDGALQSFLASEDDALISVVNSPHLSWERNREGRIVPAYSERLNRQQLPPNYLETGAFLLSRRGSVTTQGRLGDRVGVFEVPESQAVDIDTKQDWIVCEAMLSCKTIAFRVDGYRELGLGHVYRALTLAYALVEHDIVFVCDVTHRIAIEKLKAFNMRVVEVQGDPGLFEWLKSNHVDIFVNDRLDTDIDYVREVKNHVDRFVSFEDMGSGACEADAVVNAIYEGAAQHSNVYQGKEYVCLRDEFSGVRPSHFAEEVRRVLIMFGGTDPLDLTSRVYAMALKWGSEDNRVRFDFILGPGYNNSSIVDLPERGIRVSRDAVRVSDHMRRADMAICSQGRTTFELASMGVPALVLAQNERERLHTFAQMDNGFINLGLGSEVSDEDLESAIKWLMGARSVRREMHDRMLANDFRAGIGKVKRIILGESLC